MSAAAVASTPEGNKKNKNNKKKKSVHVTLDDNIQSPSHSYMEDLHSPAPRSMESGDAAAWEEAEHGKHAHLDNEAASPLTKGPVDRVQTPVVKGPSPINTFEDATAAAQADGEEDDDAANADEKKPLLSNSDAQNETKSSPSASDAATGEQGNAVLKIGAVVAAVAVVAAILIRMR